MGICFVFLLAASEQRCEHRLQSTEQNIGLTVALEEARRSAVFFISSSFDCYSLIFSSNGNVFRIVRRDGRLSVATVRRCFGRTPTRLCPVLAGHDRSVSGCSVSAISFTWRSTDSYVSIACALGEENIFAVSTSPHFRQLAKAPHASGISWDARAARKARMLVRR